MAKSCGVLHLTLLLYLFWLPSGEAGREDAHNANQLAQTVPPQATGPPGPPGPDRFRPGGRGGKGHWEAVDPYDEYGRPIEEEELKEGYSPGNMYIINLLKSYVYSGCKAGTAGDLVGAMQRPSFSFGERYIIKLLSSYFSSGCEAARNEAKGSADDEGVVDNAVKGLKGANYTTGEFHILNRLSCSFSSGCRVDADKSSEGGAGRNVQFVVLQLFLLVFGACLTWIEM